jgi:hypothetical protein
MNKQMLRLLQDILTSLLDELGTLPVGLLENVLLAQISAHKEVGSIHRVETRTPITATYSSVESRSSCIHADGRNYEELCT